MFCTGELSVEEEEEGRRLSCESAMTRDVRTDEEEELVGVTVSAALSSDSVVAGDEKGDGDEVDDSLPAVSCSSAKPVDVEYFVVKENNELRKESADGSCSVFEFLLNTLISLSVCSLSIGELCNESTSGGCWPTSLADAPVSSAAHRGDDGRGVVGPDRSESVINVTGEKDRGDAVVDEYRSNKSISPSASSGDCDGDGEAEVESTFLRFCGDTDDLRDIVEQCREVCKNRS